MWASPRVRTSMSAPDLRGNIEVKGRVKGGGQECPPHTFTVQKQKATLIPERGLHLMPATTYSPAHFGLQYNRPCGALPVDRRADSLRLRSGQALLACSALTCRNDQRLVVID